MSQQTPHQNAGKTTTNEARTMTNRRRLKPFAPVLVVAVLGGAALVGATRVRVNEVLVGFTKRKMIAIDRQLRISILDRAELEAYLL